MRPRLRAPQGTRPQSESRPAQQLRLRRAQCMPGAQGHVAIRPRQFIPGGSIDLRAPVIDWLYRRNSCKTCERAEAYLGERDITARETVDARKTRFDEPAALSLA